MNKWVLTTRTCIARRQGRAQGAHDAHQAQGPQAVRHARARRIQPGGRREGRQEDRSKVRFLRSVERLFCFEKPQLSKILADQCTTGWSIWLRNTVFHMLLDLG